MVVMGTGWVETKKTGGQSEWSSPWQPHMMRGQKGAAGLFVVRYAGMQEECRRWAQKKRMPDFLAMGGV